MDQFQHPDSIWTWKSNTRGTRASLWIPYLAEIKKVKASRWSFAFNGGEFVADLKQVDLILIYGASGSLPVDFLDQLAINRIPLLVHRRNMDAPGVFLPAPKPDSADVMSNQIIARRNEAKSAYVARTLVRARFDAVSPELVIPQSSRRKFNGLRSVEEVRNMEAQWAARYWKKYFASLNAPEETRRSKSPITSALDACSFFLFGVTLRWILLHHLSPQHGFLHRPTQYPALAYDLMEPYRYLGENAVAEAVSWKGTESEDLTKASLSALKHILDETVYVPTTRQHVRRKNLIHGGVLAMRAWLADDMPRFTLPTEGPKKGGRPIKVSYTLPGDRTRRKSA